MDMLRKFSHSSLALPLASLAVLLLFNAVFVDDFFKIEVMENGNLFGRPIDILYRASSLIILALGMTFVIATAGVDISVGAVCAISAASCCVILGGDISGEPAHPFFLAILAGLGAGLLAGLTIPSIFTHTHLPCHIRIVLYAISPGTTLKYFDLSLFELSFLAVSR